MSVCLLSPTLGNLTAPFTYGRWAPVHLNGQLYGWTALPLVALLLRVYWPTGHWQAWPRFALTAWSAALAFACADWLMGGSGGKLFMDWAGVSRVFFPLALLGLSLCLAVGILCHWGSWTPAGRTLRLALWFVLLPIPFLLAWAADPARYPPVNPDSGGATGSSLLGSSLVLILIHWVSPGLMGAERVSPPGRIERVGPVLLVLHILASLLALQQGDVSHHDPVQVGALFSLWIWPPLLWVRLRAFAWSAAARRWLLSFGLWGLFLTVSACLMFLPGALERMKFTNVLVAHTHLAMAGMLTGFNMLLLVRLDPCLEATLGRIQPFLWWHVGLGLHLGVLFAAGALESTDPAVLFSGHLVMDVVYFLRIPAGLLMLAASVVWMVPPQARAPAGTHLELL